jgi:uracil DNA glycosylase
MDDEDLLANVTPTSPTSTSSLTQAPLSLENITPELLNQFQQLVYLMSSTQAQQGQSQWPMQGVFLSLSF